MRWCQQILDTEGQPCGRFEAAICNNELQLDECIRFSALPGGFDRYRSHIALETIWPMAVLIDIEVEQEKRRRGLGRSALDDFYCQAARKGAVLAIGKVGWPPTEDWEVHRDRNLKIYRNAGWVFFPRQGVEPYFIYRDLTNEA
jgi:GNAT superfamily N-acetyltransferase